MPDTIWRSGPRFVSNKGVFVHKLLLFPDPRPSQALYRRTLTNRHCLTVSHCESGGCRERAARSRVEPAEYNVRSQSDRLQYDSLEYKVVALLVGLLALEQTISAPICNPSTPTYIMSRLTNSPCKVFPSAAGLRSTTTPAASRALIFEFASPLPPLTIAPVLGQIYWFNKAISRGYGNSPA